MYVDSLYFELILSRHDICRDGVSCMMGLYTIAIVDGLKQWLE
jgi:hypothetical protein